MKTHGNKGKIRSKETKELISKNSARFWLGKKRPNVMTDEVKNKIKETKRKNPQVAWNKGLEWIERRGASHHWYGRNSKGINNFAYKKDRSSLKKFNDTTKDRRSSAYVTWRKEVWLRDNFKCKIGNPDCGGRIEAHHILGWSQYPELRYQINNGITLCHAHHPRKRAEEKRLIPTFQEMVSMSVSKE